MYIHRTLQLARDLCTGTSKPMNPVPHIDTHKMLVCPCDLMSQSLIDRLGSYIIGSTFLKLLPTAHLHLRRDLSPETSKNTYPVSLLLYFLSCLVMSYIIFNSEIYWVVVLNISSIVLSGSPNNHPIMAIYTTYIPLIYIYIANWVIMCIPYHLSGEPETTIDLMTQRL